MTLRAEVSPRAPSAQLIASEPSSEFIAEVLSGIAEVLSGIMTVKGKSARKALLHRRCLFSGQWGSHLDKHSEGDVPHWAKLVWTKSWPWSFSPTSLLPLSPFRSAATSGLFYFFLFQHRAYAISFVSCGSSYLPIRLKFLRAEINSFPHSTLNQPQPTLPMARKLWTGWVLTTWI